MKYEVYIFSNEFSIRENFFLTKVLQKYRTFKSFNDVESPFAYISVEDSRRILGRHYAKSSVKKFESLGFIESVVVSKNSYGQDVVGFIPIKTQYTKTKTTDKTVKNYYQEKHSSLSKIAKKIYKTITNSQINITREKFMEIANEMYERKSKIKKLKKTKEEYLFGMNNFYNEICDFLSKNKTEKSEYVSEDSFGNRLHSIFSRLPKEVRQNYVTVNLKSTVELDLKQSQPTFLAKILEEEMGENSFSNAINSGIDIYELMYGDREKGKGRIYYVFFGERMPKEFYKTFPDAAPIVDMLKYRKTEGNNSDKEYSNLAYILQREESKVFREVWKELIKNNISFIPVHDSIIVKEEDMNLSYEIMNNVISKYIKHYTITISK